ncbi:MAG: hypothetical protein V6006_02205 [Candidatus Dasytiphilus stammeri]
MGSLNIDYHPPQKNNFIFESKSLILVIMMLSDGKIIADEFNHLSLFGYDLGVAMIFPP